MLFLTLQQIPNSNIEAETGVCQKLWDRDMPKATVLGEALNQQNNPTPTAKKNPKTKNTYLILPRSTFTMGSGNLYRALPCVQITVCPTMCQSTVLGEGEAVLSNRYTTPAFMGVTVWPVIILLSTNTSLSVAAASRGFRKQTSSGICMVAGCWTQQRRYSAVSFLPCTKIPLRDPQDT